MAGTSSISGLASGIDTSSWVKGLMEIERAPLRNMEARKTIETMKLDTWKAIQAKLLNVKIKAVILNREFTFKESQATSSNTDVISIASTKLADPVTQGVKVTQLARAQQTLSRGVASVDTPLMAGGDIVIRPGNGTDDNDVNAYTELGFLNGGAGIDTAGGLRIFNRNGSSVEVDVSGADDLQSVIDSINSAASSIGITADINEDGNGLALRDTSGGAGSITVQEVGGTTAQDLGLLGGAESDRFEGADLDPVYRLTIDSTNNTLEGVRDALNDLNGPFSASIINTGSGAQPYKLSISSSNTGVIGALSITDTASQIVGEAVGTGDGTKGAVAGDFALDYVPADIGSVADIAVDGVAYTVRAAGGNTGTGNEVEVDLATGDLRFFVDGVASNVTGAVTATYTPADLDLDQAAGLGKIAQTAQDARIELGATNPEVIERHSNTVDDVIPGVVMNLLKTSDEVVNIDVKPDIEGIKTAIKDFFDAYNGTMELIRTQGAYDAETQKKGGPLFGDSNLILVENELQRTIMDDVPGLPSSMRSIFQIGVTVGSDGKLAVDDAELTEALTYRLTDVVNLFTRKTNIALGTEGTTVASQGGTEPGYSADKLIDGVRSGDWDAGEGWMGTRDLSTEAEYLTLDLGGVRSLSKLVLDTLNTSSYPAADWGVNAYEVQYLKLGGVASKASDWVTAETVSGNTAGSVTNYLIGVTTEQIRLKITGTNAADNRARLTEIELYEDQGVAGKMNSVLGSLTDTSDSIIAYAQQTINTQIQDYSDRMTQLEARLAAKEELLTKQFTEMEKYLGEMQGTGSWLASQLSALPTFSSSSSKK